MNKLIINSDDFGYGKAINHAIIDTHQKGILTSTTLMTNTPGFEHAVELAQENANLGVGVHLVLTFLKPLRKDVSSLTDKDGNFFRLTDYRTGNIKVDVDELYKEWDTQIQKVIEAGIQPTHLDTHHHAHTFNQQHFEVFLKLAQKYDLPIRGNASFDLEHSCKTTTYFEPAFDEIGLLTQAEQINYLEYLYRRIRKNPSTELMCHTGYIDEYLLASSSFVEPRIYQVGILTHSPFAQQIKKDPNIQLATFADL